MAAPWFKSTPDSRRYPRLQGARKSDVVVVGAGIAGCMTAYRLAKNGVQVTLIEANHVATGDTGYTTAFVTRIPDTALAPLVTRYGERFMERLIAFNKQTQRSIRDLVLQQKIKCDWQECRSFIVSYHKEDPDLAGEWSVLHQVEPLAHKATRQELNQSAPQATDGIVIEQEAHFDPRKFLIGLLQTPIGKKITIFEESAVTNVTATTKSVHVTTDLGAITANKVVIATGLPIMDEFKPLFTTHITYALLAHYKQQPVSDDLVWDTDLPYFYYRRYIDRIMLGGADSKPGFESAIAQQKLDSFLAKRLPGDYAVTERWSGSLFASQDGLPYADQHPHHPGRIWVISGLAGNGMVMGSAAATLVADSITDTHNGAQELFAFARTKATIKKQQTMPTNNPSQQNKSAWTPVARIGLPLIYLLALIAPALVFFGQRGGFGFLSGVKDPQVLGLLLFPLVGLYAFTLIWAQVILGSSMPIWRRVYPWIETFHRTQGIFVLLFAGLHPTLLLLAYGQAYFNYDFVLPEQQIFIYIGQIQLLLIILTVATALLRKTRLVKKWWRYVHWANYLVFALVWIHSWELGSDVKPTWLRFVWIFFALTVVLSLLGRILRGVRQRKLAITPLAGAGTGEPIKTTFTRVATLSDLGQNKAHCLNVGGQAIVLYRINDRVFATTNTCTHAGGPLCEGSLKSTTVTCPWHGSQFDVTSGKVVAGPATRAVKTYPVRIVDGRVEIAL